MLLMPVLHELSHPIW